MAVPRTLAEALAVLAARPEALVVAGGSDVVPALRAGRREQPAAWLLLHELGSLAGIAPQPGGGLRIGAATTVAALERDPRVRPGATALADAAALIGAPATRTVATVGGNLVNGSPAMDLGAPLLALGATVELAAAGGTRRLPLEQFLLGPGRVDLRAGELLVAIELPPAAAPGDAAPRAGSAYVRIGGRAAMEVALAGAAAEVVLAPGGATIAAARVALCAVASTCLRAPAAEALLIGAAPEPAVLDAAARAAVGHTAAIDDHRAPAAYREAVVEVALRRALDTAVERAR
ncbi:FAD binding domain-containing protein [Conexibacter stalactiti]|uniref:FAD binding domain-containing protein n=1 Tax=Conexibacter stalactiti TaxID=1940611 RepID=A0ABU4HSJ2_9ACTN|nr:FAD binding domain-containing protein [Conexibacter stalactiti]MDW5596298.1 FAD binding domain-containing protein [Conexibacter stalactiti]MEC5036940.1 FAD binding domain-containing protein [Conexibacter stalactiti]